MTKQPELFSAEIGQQLKKEGMALGSENKAKLLQLAREIAYQIALSRESREVTADDVGKVLHELYQIDSLGPAAGSLFSSRIWEFTGRRIASERKKNHGREIKVWRLK